MGLLLLEACWHGNPSSEVAIPLDALPMLIAIYNNNILYLFKTYLMYEQNPLLLEIIIKLNNCLHTNIPR